MEGALRGLPAGSFAERSFTLEGEAELLGWVGVDCSHLVRQWRELPRRNRDVV